MKKYIYTHTLHITSLSHVSQFQISLPRDAGKITGIRTAISGNVNALPRIGQRGDSLYVRQPVLGDLRLQVCHAANWFYAENVMENEIHLGALDISRLGFKVNPFSHGGKQSFTKIDLKLSNPLITGVYKDFINERVNTPFAYEVKVYVWYDVK